MHLGKRLHVECILFQMKLTDIYIHVFIILHFSCGGNPGFSVHCFIYYIYIVPYFQDGNQGGACIWGSEAVCHSGIVQNQTCLASASLLHPAHILRPRRVFLLGLI